MAKQFVIAAMEEVIGEYVLNMSKESIRIAAMKGEIKLNDVQLDGDLVGSHFFGLVGLSNFGILSCSAKSLRISVPWTQLEKEPTRFDMEGVHLVCVPLMPSTANKTYGSGTAVDPRCTLRTRAKRLTLARLERNFWNGQIPGEGPPLKRVRRAAKDVERELKRSFKKDKANKSAKTRRSNSFSSTSFRGKTLNDSKSMIGNPTEYAEMEEALDDLVYKISVEETSGISEDEGSAHNVTDEDLPHLPRDWKVKLREKVLRNLEAVMKNVHIRCEVSQSAKESNQHEPNFVENDAFAFGFTLDSLVVRTANESWEAGSHDVINPKDGSEISSVKDHLGPNEYVVVNNKIGYFNKLSLYWDNEPPILLSETDALQGNFLNQPLDKLSARITAAMEALHHGQEIGLELRQSLSMSAPTTFIPFTPHTYVCESLDAEVRLRTSDRTRPGPISCSADVLPLDFTFHLLPSQIVQYQRLKATILAQQRFDTMLKQRPLGRPIEQPRAWWAYAISCVMARPNSRPWEDVASIAKSRVRYIELASKKNSKSQRNKGYHGGLSQKESDELLELEDRLPVEVLVAFHTIALRKVYATKHQTDLCNTESQMKPLDSNKTKYKSPGIGRFRLPRLSSGSRKKNISRDSEPRKSKQRAITEIKNNSKEKSINLLEAMNLRLGKKIWFVDWNFHDAVINVYLRRSESLSPVLVVLRADGNARSFGIGKRDILLDITQFDILHGGEKVLFLGPTDSDVFAEEESPSPAGIFHLGGKKRFRDGPDMKTPSMFLDLPPNGSICRIVAGKDDDTLKFSVSAHPATLVWTTSLFKGIADFFTSQSSDTDSDLTVHIRNATTPLAKKAQLALLSPAAMSIHLNIAGPKVFVPLISSDKEGTLFFDAGTVRMASNKHEGETEADWDFNARDISVTFVRGISSSRFGKEGHSYFRTYGLPYAPIGRGETSVVRPLSINASSRRRDDMLESLRNVDIVVSPICLNLVDAEMLARSFGKWYAVGLGIFRRRVLKGKKISKDTTNDQLPQPEILRNKLPCVTAITVEKIEMALEGHSKKWSSFHDDKSMISQDSYLEFAPPTRAYLVELFRISLRRTTLASIETSELSFVDASIVRLKDVAQYLPLKSRRDVEPENCVLSRAQNDEERKNEPSRTHIFRACLSHDLYNHLDELEIDVDSVVLRVTPTTLKDCAKAFRRVAELAQVMTKEMERKVHEEGRKARRKERNARDGDGSRIGSVANFLDRPVSPSVSDVMTEITGMDQSSSTVVSSDSSILFRVTVRDCNLMAGRPTSQPEGTSSFRNRGPSFVVVQILSNALIMFQSIENQDASGSKTLHISVDNLSALATTEFLPVSLLEIPPMVEPIAADFRIGYLTEHFGCVVSQDISFDCDSIKSCLTPNDLSIMASIARTMYERSQAFGKEYTSEDLRARKFAPFIRYKKKGTGIATRVSAELQAFSFVLLKAYKTHSGAPQFLDFSVKEVKASFEGCMSALNGEYSCLIAVNFFNSDLRDWEYAVEPFPLSVLVDQVPNEVTIKAAPTQAVQLNITGLLLRDFSELQTDLLRDRGGADTTAYGALHPTALSTVGLRRASESSSVIVHNKSGIDIEIVIESEKPYLVTNGTTSIIGTIEGDDVSVLLRVPMSSASLIGEREPVKGLTVSRRGNRAYVYLLKSTLPFPCFNSGESGFFRCIEGRSSPESFLTDITVALDWGYYNAEPVVEWCMQNQKLVPGVSDLFSLTKGKDLLSNIVWSPEQDLIDDIHYVNPYSLGSKAERDVLSLGQLYSPERKTPLHAPPQKWSNWQPPYLSEDPPEWTDMTCMLRMARERLMLPDNRWMWVNEWSVDLHGMLELDTDADGWSYAMDFETFSNSKCYYERGAACRRRRWTRTRMLKPPPLNDPFRPMKFVWENFKEDNGSIRIEVRSPVRVHNRTPYSLVVFAFAPSWAEDVCLGTVDEMCILNVPVPYACATHMRIGKNSGSQQNIIMSDCMLCDRFLIVPTSHTSSRYDRIFVDLKDVSSTILHFLIDIQSDNGIVDISIEPVFQIINLLPCQLECHVGEVARASDKIPADSRAKTSKRIRRAESLIVQSGKSRGCSAVSPLRKPHLSIRVPGYKWSNWQLVVNRNTETWRPTENEEENLFIMKGENSFANERKNLILFERIGRKGDPLILIMSVECGHSPIIRIYSQYMILDKTGFGCHFSDGFADFLASVPNEDTSRRSFFSKELRNSDVKKDLELPGHQWSIGQSGMTLFFSKQENLTLSIEAGIPRLKGSGNPKSKWIAPIDVSNVIPKTVFLVDELTGKRRFELAITVTQCPGVFHRTKMITLLPRFQIVNLLHRELLVKQNGCADGETLIPSQCAVPFHWENGSLEPKVLLGTPSLEERVQGKFAKCWTNGCVQADRIGITSLRLPTAESNFLNIPLVVQAEVRLATQEQSSAVVIVIWSGGEESNPLYMIRNSTRYTILCRQSSDEKYAKTQVENKVQLCGNNSDSGNHHSSFECGVDVGPILSAYLNKQKVEEFVWVLRSSDVTCFGLENPERPHVIEWTFVENEVPAFGRFVKKSFQDVDAMGSSSILTLPDKSQVRCQIRAEHSTKVIEFVEVNLRSGTQNIKTDGLSLRTIQSRTTHNQSILESHSFDAFREADQVDDDESVTFGFRLEVPVLTISVVDNSNPALHGREILLCHFDRALIAFSQGREGYHEFELRLSSFQVDNHVPNSVHPVLIFCPQASELEPLLHMSAVRRFHLLSNTRVFRYAAIRLLDVEIFLDRRTAETFATFIQPLVNMREIEGERPFDWVGQLTTVMENNFGNLNMCAPRNVEKFVFAANLGRIYFEQLHLHPVRLSLTFTQEWMDWRQSPDTVMIFQFIRGMASIANAPLVFTSFVVGHVFEAPQALLRIVATHYSSQLTKQIFGILGSLAMFGAPADFISNVGSGVRDFFYEPMQGAVLGPRQFIEGLEAGTQSLARGVFVGVVRGAANVTDVVNSNLAGLTADEDFIGERKAYQRMLTDALSRGAVTRTFAESLNLAYGSVARGIKSGAYGIVEQPIMYASKHGPVGFLKGVGKAVVGAVVKPVVGLGDGVVLVMNHMSDVTSKQRILPKIPKRLRRALPRRLAEKPNCVSLEPYDERAAKAQTIVTGGDSVDDVYLGHVNVQSHLLIASEQCLWAIDRISREPWCVSWSQISHFRAIDGGIQISVFSQTGLKTYFFQVENRKQWLELQRLLSLQRAKMANHPDLSSYSLSAKSRCSSMQHAAMTKAPLSSHVFGSLNNAQKRLSSVKDEIDLVEQCFARVRKMSSDQNAFLRAVDEEAWNLVSVCGQVFSGLSSRRCVVAGIINASGSPIQVKSAKLIEGGSPCYSIPTKEFDIEQGILHTGGAILFFGWGIVPNLVQAGNVCMSIETNACICKMTDQKSRDVEAKALPGYQVGFLEKSYDDTGWWAKYWLIVRIG